MNPITSTYGFKVLLWEFLLEKSTIPVAKGLTPVIVKEFDGSYLLLWWKIVIIISPRRGNQCRKTDQETLNLNT